MATLYGVNRTIYNDAKQSAIISGSYKTRNMGFMYDEYTFAAASIGDVVQIGDKLPVGAIVTQVVVRNAALGASTTLSIGDAGSATRYVAATATSSAGAINFQSTGDISTGWGYVVTGTSDTQLLLTLAGGAATGAIKVFIQYAFAG